jgi:hypothetical protein
MSIRMPVEVGHTLYLRISIADDECYISEDDSESHCMKKITTEFPTLLYPGYKCSFGQDSAKCTFGPKL